MTTQKSRIINQARATIRAKGDRPTRTSVMKMCRAAGFPVTPQDIITSLAPTGALEASAHCEALDCQGAASLKSTVTEAGEILYMPAGQYEICPSQGGRPCPVTVLVDCATADALEQQRQVLTAKGKLPFLSISHESDSAAFWVSRFVWDARIDATGKLATGVWADGTWTAAGKEARDGRSYRSFSPTFHVDGVNNNPCRIVCQESARPNMGALENDPAFGAAMSPIWARNATAEDAQAEETWQKLEFFEALDSAVDSFLVASAAQDAATTRSEHLQSSVLFARAERAYLQAGELASQNELLSELAKCSARVEACRTNVKFSQVLAESLSA